MRPAESRAALNTEYGEHGRAGVSSCRFIRPLLDVIPSVDGSPVGMKNGDVMYAMGGSQVPQGLVFQWIERNLYDFDPEICRRDYVLPEAVATGVLQALVPFENNERIHSGGITSAQHARVAANGPRYQTGQHLDQLSRPSQLRSEALGFGRV